MLSRMVQRILSPDPKKLQHEVDVFRVFLAMRAYESLAPLLARGVGPDADEYMAQTERLAVELEGDSPVKIGHVERKEVVRRFLGDRLAEAHANERPTCKVVARPSNVHGRGVFVDGYAPPGTLLGVYPGIVYLPEEIRQLPHYPHIDKNPLLFMRYDDLILDPEGYDTLAGTLSSSPLPVAQRGELGDGTPGGAFGFHLGGRRDMRLVPSSPLGIGHLFNHPPEGKQPSVLGFAFDVPLTVPLEVALSVPNRYLAPPHFFYRHVGCHVRTVAFVSVAHLRDEEVFLNYRYNPRLELPSWYAHADKEEAMRLWEPHGGVQPTLPDEETKK